VWCLVETVCHKIGIIIREWFPTKTSNYKLPICRA